MRTGDIWGDSDTDNEPLFMTVTHFRVTVGILNGEWKEKGLEHSLVGRSWFAWYNAKEYFKKITPWSMK